MASRLLCRRFALCSSKELSIGVGHQQRNSSAINIVARQSQLPHTAQKRFGDPARHYSHSLCNKLKLAMVNSAAETNGCENGNGILKESLPEFREVQIPVPWGHLSAKVWGKENGNPILGLHGWQDNAGTFDRLIPMLSSDMYIVCLDMCGHGLSSHYPPGMMYHYWDYMAHIRLVANHFGWSRFSILGHSLGGIIGSMVAATLPDMVDKLVMIDIVKPISLPAKYQPGRTGKAIESYIQILKKLEQSPPSYSHDAARDRLVQANGGSIDGPAAEVLMRRGVAQNSEGGYFFSRDLRLVIPSISNYTAEQHAEYAKKVNCPLLLIKAKNGPLYEDKAVYDEFIKLYQEHSQAFDYVEVEGTHHVHLVNPENVAPVIDKFLTVAAPKSA